MKAMILAAGMGTRLKPWTLSHPKALVPVGGIPMLERVVTSLKTQGFDDIVVNIHHFGNQIIDFINSRDFGVRIRISDERDKLLDTGGGIMAAAPLLFGDNDGPVLIHNVDILSNADLRKLMEDHDPMSDDASLLVSDRDSSRKLIADADGHNLRGWLNIKTGEHKPESFIESKNDIAVAFSGIHIISKSIALMMEKEHWQDVFPIMDFYLSHCSDGKIKCRFADDLSLIDIGKPDTLKRANEIFKYSRQ